VERSRKNVSDQATGRTGRRTVGRSRPGRFPTDEPTNGNRPPKNRDVNVLSFLQDGHEDIHSQYEGFQTAGGDDRYFLANRIIRELELHNRIEEEVFYPAVEKAVERQGDKRGAARVRAALRGHRRVKEYLAKVKERPAQDDRLAAQIDALMEQVRRHVDLEERELFPVAHAVLGEAGLMRLRQDAREWQEEFEHRWAA
jgi:iron-sulfur cluster repair protein YtfE (RIC family)